MFKAMNLITLFLLLTGSLANIIEIDKEEHKQLIKEFRDSVIPYGTYGTAATDGTGLTELMTLQVDSEEVLEIIHGGLSIEKRYYPESRNITVPCTVNEYTDSNHYNITLENVTPVVVSGSMVGFLLNSEIPNLEKRGTGDWISGGIVLVTGGYIVLKAGVRSAQSGSWRSVLLYAREAAIEEAAFLGDMMFTFWTHMKYGPNQNWWGAVTSDVGDIEAGVNNAYIANEKRQFTAPRGDYPPGWKAISCLGSNTMALSDSTLASIARDLINKVNLWSNAGALTFDLGWTSPGGNYWVMKTKIIPMSKTWNDDPEDCAL